MERGERGFEAGHTERRLLERDVLLVASMRCVIGRDARDRAAPECVAERLPVVFRAQRRIHLHVRVERAHGLVREHEVVGRHLSGRPRASASATSSAATDSRADRCIRWICLPSASAEREVALDHDALGRRRIRPEAQLGGHHTLVRLAPARQRRLLAMEHERKPRDPAVLQCAAHETGRHDGQAVIGECSRARRRERSHLGQFLPELALADGGHETGRDDSFLTRALDERPEYRRRVDDRVRVRYREDRAVATRSGRLGAAANRLFVFAPGCPEVDVRVDERRRE